MRYEDLRTLMVERQLIKRHIDNQQVLESFRKVPRHIFVPEKFRRFAYDDHPLDIGEGQTISQPYIVALMIELLSVKKNDTVLEIGTGSGYQTAILAELVKEVYTVERIPSLMIDARKKIDELGYKNIFYRVGDGSKGWEKAYPVKTSFSKIIVSAAAPEIPKSLIDQLEEGGSMIIPAGNRIMQSLILILKRDNETIEKRYGGCTFVPLIGEEGWKNE